MTNYLKPFLLTIVIILSLETYGQLNYQNGYVITLEDDTIFGKINDGGSFRNSRSCLFKDNKGGKAKKYSPQDIKSYCLIGDKTYVAKQIFYKREYKYIFLDVLIGGKVNLYHDRRNKDLEYYLEKDDGILIGLEQKEVDIREKSLIAYESNKYDKVVINAYKDSLRSVFSDCRKIQAQIPNIDYSTKAIVNITKSYIDETCDNNNCSYFEKNMSQERDRLGIFSGIQLNQITFFTPFSYLSPDPDKSEVKSELITSTPIGISYNIPLNVINDRISVELEAYMNEINFEQSFIDNPYFADNYKINSLTLNIPVLLKYEIDRKIISPSIAIGKSAGFVLNSKTLINDRNDDDLLLHPVQKSGWIYEIGLDYKLKPKLSIYSNLRLQTFNNMLVSYTNSRINYNLILEEKSYELGYKTYLAALIVGIKF